MYDNIKSTKIASDNRFVLRYEKKRLINISKVTTIMNQKAYSYVSMIIDSIEDTKWILNASLS